jgi:hypothetical protein
MAVTNHERVRKALDLLKGGLARFVDREFKSAYKDRASMEASRFMGDARLNTQRPIADWDAAALLKLMWDSWNDIFRKTLGPAERSLLSELRDHRNKWAHQQTFSGDDAYRALDSARRLLIAVSAPQADEIEDVPRRETVLCQDKGHGFSPDFSRRLGPRAYTLRSRLLRDPHLEQQCHRDSRRSSPDAAIRARKTAPHPGPLPASGAREKTGAVIPCERCGYRAAQSKGDGAGGHI